MTASPTPPGESPDPALAAVDPVSPIPGDAQAVAHAAPYSGYGSPSAFSGPPPSRKQAAGYLPVIALVVGGISVLTGLTVLVGAVLGLLGVVLGIIALRRGTGRAMAITGLVLSAVGLLLGGVFTTLVFTVLPQGAAAIG